MSEYNDNELLYLLSENEDFAFELLMEKYEPLIINRLRRFHIKKEYWDDYYQECIILLYKCATNYREDITKTFNKYFDRLLQYNIQNLLRKDKNGFEYMYSEGAMSPYDELNLPAGTMLTSEGTTNRSTHIIKDPKDGRLRILTPIECERINQFPDNWTNSGMPEKRRYFMMGNALVCGIIKKIGIKLSTIIEKED